MQKLFLLLLLTNSVISFKLPFLDYPYHASCRVKWYWSNNSCDEIFIKMLKIKYKPKVYFTITSPIKKYVDNISLQFSSQLNNSCLVNAYSRAKESFVLFDEGYNYCNLKKLVNKLKNYGNYIETTSDKICTQYSISNCTRLLSVLVEPKVSV